jgi:hypothetical protein
LILSSSVPARSGPRNLRVICEKGRKILGEALPRTEKQYSLYVLQARNIAIIQSSAQSM